MLSPRYDALVIGAGPAGSSLALRLARAGWSVALVDRRHFPRFKACGEFLSPECRPLLADLGVADEVSQLGARTVRGMVLHGHGHRVRAPFVSIGRAAPPGGAGLAIRREVFDHVLVRAAVATGRVDLREGWTLANLLHHSNGAVVGARIRAHDGRCEDVRAAITIGADGVRSEVARQLGVQRTIGWLDRLALTTRYEGAPSDGFSEVHLQGDRYFAASTVDGGLFSLNLVVDRDLLHREKIDAEALLDREIDRCAPLREKLAGARRVERVRGVGPLACRTTCQTFAGAALVGDACGYVDPITGEGIYFALWGAQSLAACLLDAGCARTLPRKALDRYARARRREIVPRLWMALALQRGLRHPRVVRSALSAMEARSSLAELLVAVTGDYVPLAELLRPAVWRHALTRPRMADRSP